MPDSVPEFFSREELLGGWPARQASTLLFAIESRTAYLVAHSRHTAARFVLPKPPEFDKSDLLEVLAQGRDLPFQLTIQDLERYAPEWAVLVPDNPGVKAAIAHSLAQEYTFPAQHTPRLRQALSLDDAAVKEIYQHYYTQPLQTIYSPKITRREYLRWLWTSLARWVEELSPFWTAFALTLVEMVGASLLALPLTLAGLDLLVGVVLLLVFGLINLLTVWLLLTNIARQGGAAAQTRQLTIALQQSRQQLVTAREEERRRLRRDLHDGLGPQLASQTLTLNAIGKLLERDPTKARELLEHLQAQSQTAIEDIRRLVYGLRPPALDELGLVTALREGARQYGQVGGHVEIVTDPQPLPTLPAAVEVAVYRIAQEAITNVIRHTQTKQCHLDISVHDHRLALTITNDEGSGFPPDVHLGVGLNSMRERAEELGGHIRFDNQPAGGARVQAWLPLPGDEE